MRKEMTIFIICVLAFSVDVLCLWQIFNFRLDGTFLIDKIYGGSVITLLAVAGLCLLRLNYVLLRKIIDRKLN